jgi:hypothetical protein
MHALGIRTNKPGLVAACQSLMFRVLPVEMPRPLAQIQAKHSKTATANSVQNDHVQPDTTHFERGQKMDPARMLAGFRAPWTVVETTGEFIIKDARGRAPAYFYWWGDGRTLLTRDEARCLAEKLPSCQASWHSGEKGATTHRQS